MWNQVREHYSSVIGFKIGNAVNMKLHVAVCDQSPCLPYKGLHHLGPYSAWQTRAALKNVNLMFTLFYPSLSPTIQCNKQYDDIGDD